MEHTSDEFVLNTAIDQLYADKVTQLTQALPVLALRDRDFAGSLISNFNRYGRLSDKQLAWVDTLVARAMNPQVPQVAAETLNFQAIQELFDRAGQRLKRVKIKLQAPEGTPVVFNRAGPASKYAGQVMITDGLPFGQNRFFGRIEVNGDFYPTGKATDAVKGIVREFAEDPAGTAGRYGRLTGGCSFCNHPLKDERSTAVGYGPVCAKNFGLVWG